MCKINWNWPSSRLFSPWSYIEILVRFIKPTICVYCSYYSNFSRYNNIFCFLYYRIVTPMVTYKNWDSQIFSFFNQTTSFLWWICNWLFNHYMNLKHKVVYIYRSISVFLFGLLTIYVSWQHLSIFTKTTKYVQHRTIDFRSSVYHRFYHSHYSIIS